MKWQGNTAPSTRGRISSSTIASLDHVAHQAVEEEMPAAVRLEDDTLDLEGPGYLDESTRNEGGDVSGLGLEESKVEAGDDQEGGELEAEEGEPEVEVCMVGDYCWGGKGGREGA